MMMIDLVATCPRCYERIAMPAVPAETQLITTGDRHSIGCQQLTVKIYDIPLVEHTCQDRGNARSSVMMTPVSKAPDGEYADMNKTDCGRHPH